MLYFKIIPYSACLSWCCVTYHELSIILTSLEHSGCVVTSAIGWAMAHSSRPRRLPLCSQLHCDLDSEDRDEKTLLISFL